MSSKHRFFVHGITTGPGWPPSYQFEKPHLVLLVFGDDGLYVLNSSGPRPHLGLLPRILSRWYCKGLFSFQRSKQARERTDPKGLDLEGGGVRWRSFWISSPWSDQYGPRTKTHTTEGFHCLRKIVASTMEALTEIKLSELDLYYWWIHEPSRNLGPEAWGAQARKRVRACACACVETKV